MGIDPKSQRQMQWLHDHRCYRLRKPDGTEYIDRRAGGPNDVLIEELTPPYPIAEDHGMRKGDFYDCVKPEGKNDLGFIVTDYDDASFLIKTKHADKNGNPVDCFCIHDWEEQSLYMDGKYRARRPGCFDGWSSGIV